MAIHLQYGTSCASLWGCMPATRNKNTNSAPKENNFTCLQRGPCPDAVHSDPVPGPAFSEPLLLSRSPSRVAGCVPCPCGPRTDLQRDTGNRAPRTRRNTPHSPHAHHAHLARSAPHAPSPAYAGMWRGKYCMQAKKKPRNKSGRASRVVGPRVGLAACVPAACACT